jgi:hypothetical protein
MKSILGVRQKNILDNTLSRHAYFQYLRPFLHYKNNGRHDPHNFRPLCDNAANEHD